MCAKKLTVGELHARKSIKMINIFVKNNNIYILRLI